MVAVRNRDLERPVYINWDAVYMDSTDPWEDFLNIDAEEKYNAKLARDAVNAMSREQVDKTLGILNLSNSEASSDEIFTAIILCLSVLRPGEFPDKLMIQDWIEDIFRNYKTNQKTIVKMWMSATRRVYDLESGKYERRLKRGIMEALGE